MKFRLANWKHGIWRRIFSKKVGHLSSSKIYVSFTFDTEEDWENTKPPFLITVWIANIKQWKQLEIFIKLAEQCWDTNTRFVNTYIQPWLRETPVVALTHDPDNLLKNKKWDFIPIVLSS